jgi:hypothetical protein
MIEDRVWNIESVGRIKSVGIQFPNLNPGGTKFPAKVGLRP